MTGPMEVKNEIGRDMHGNVIPFRCHACVEDKETFFDILAGRIDIEDAVYYSASIDSWMCVFHWQSIIWRDVLNPKL